MLKSEWKPCAHLYYVIFGLQLLFVDVLSIVLDQSQRQGVNLEVQSLFESSPLKFQQAVRLTTQGGFFWGQQWSSVLIKQGKSQPESHYRKRHVDTDSPTDKDTDSETDLSQLMIVDDVAIDDDDDYNSRAESKEEHLTKRCRLFKHSTVYVDTSDTDSTSGGSASTGSDMESSDMASVSSHSGTSVADNRLVSCVQDPQMYQHPQQWLQLTNVSNNNEDSYTMQET